MFSSPKLLEGGFWLVLAGAGHSTCLIMPPRTVTGLCTTRQTWSFCCQCFDQDRFNKCHMVQMVSRCFIHASLRFRSPTWKSEWSFTWWHYILTYWNHKGESCELVSVLDLCKHLVCVNNLPKTGVGLFLRKSPCTLCPYYVFEWVWGSELCCSVYIVIPNGSQQHKGLTGGVNMKLSSVVKGNNTY